MHRSGNSMIDYLAALARQLSGFDSEYVILIMLMDLEFVEKHNGFEYLREAIYILCEEHEALVTQSLYSAVAARCGRRVSDSVIERSIRTAIEAAWENQGQLWRIFFPSDKRPSNIEFISKMAKYLELWKGCCKAYEKRKARVKNER